MIALALWPSRDPIGERGGLNLYGFVKNNGVNWIDSLGHAITILQDVPSKTLEFVTTYHLVSRTGCYEATCTYVAVTEVSIVTSIETYIHIYTSDIIDGAKQTAVDVIIGHIPIIPTALDSLDEHFGDVPHGQVPDDATILHTGKIAETRTTASSISLYREPGTVTRTVSCGNDCPKIEARTISMPWSKLKEDIVKDWEKAGERPAKPWDKE